MAAPKKLKKRVSAYDLPTPEKKAFGERLRKARELAGLNQAEAAEQMGYSQAVQLSNMENGNRMPPTAVLMKAATIYGTTMDYLCGLTEEADRDPATAAFRTVSGMVASEIQRLIGVMVSTSVESVRKVMPSAIEGERMAHLALESHVAVLTFRERNGKRFESMPAGAMLIAKSELAAQAARQYVASMDRARRAMRVRTEGPDGTKPQVSLLPMLEGGIAR